MCHTLEQCINLMEYVLLCLWNKNKSLLSVEHNHYSLFWCSYMFGHFWPSSGNQHNTAKQGSKCTTVQFELTRACEIIYNRECCPEIAGS